MSFSALRRKLIGKLLKAYKKRYSFQNKSLLDEIEFKRILIISNKLLGDFMFCTPAISAIREKYPNAKIVIILNKRNRGIIGINPYIDGAIYMENNFSGVLQSLGKVRAFKPELSIIFHSRTPYDFLISILSGCQLVIKHYFNNDIKELFDLCDAYVLDENSPPVKNHLALVKNIGCNINNKEMFFPSVVPKKSNKTGKTKIGFQLGASKANRFLPMTTLHQLSTLIQDNYPTCEIHLFGSPNEILLGEEFMAGITKNINIVNHIGKTSLKELANKLNNIDVLLTPDTGTLHIATALKTPTVSLFVSRKKNGCEPLQDFDKHTVIYATDYNEKSNDLSLDRPLSFIPYNVIFSCLSKIISGKNI